MIINENRLRAPILLALSLALSACAAAAIPLTAAEVGIGGFEVYKVVKTSEGGSVGVSFAQKDGKEIPPQPLPLVRRIAVWPDGENERYLAEKLMASQRFDVTTPGKVRVILATARISPNIRDLTDSEQVTAFAIVCRTSKSDLVLAARDLGSVNHANGLSFSNADKVTTSELLAYSCGQGSVVWHDHMMLKVEIGDHTPSNAEISKVGGSAWGDRVIQAEGRTARQIGALPN